MIINYAVSSTLLSLRWAAKPSVHQIKAAIVRGLQRFQDFWDVQLVNTTKSAVWIYAQDFRETAKELKGLPTNAWAVWHQKRNWVVLNTQKTWTLLGLEMAMPHEFGHKYLTYYHLDSWKDYYGDPHFSHVMKLGAGTTFQGTFSPAEVVLGLQKGFKLNKRPTHPMCVQYKTNPSPGLLAKLKKVVIPYGKYHAKLYAWQTPGASAMVPPLVVPTGDGVCSCECEVY